MELRHLRLVEAVADEGNLSKAVSRLNVSSSALSHQLKEIETELGIPLFHRVNKRLVITEAGKLLLNSAKKVLKEIEQAEYDLMVFKEGQTGEIRVTTECYTCYHWLPGLMHTFSEDFPKVDIKIKTEYTKDSIDALLEGHVDAVITSNPAENPAVKYTPLFRDEMVAVMKKGHAWESKEFIEAEDFADQNVVIYGKPLDTVFLFRQLLIPNKITPKKVIEMQLTEAQIELVKAGYCVKALAKWAVEPYLKTQPIIAKPITKKGLHRTWYIASLLTENPPEYFETFIKSLKFQLKRTE